MNLDRKSGYTSILRNKKVPILAVAALVVTLTLSASSFIEDNTAAKKYEKNKPRVAQIPAETKSYL